MARKDTNLVEIPKGNRKRKTVDAPIVDKKAEIAIAKGTTLDKVTPEKIQAVLNRMESGESERAACRAENVSRASFRTVGMREGVADQYARALEILAQSQVEELEKTIEDMRNGTIDAAMARVEIDARKWFASKFLPKRYGDKLDLTSDGKALPSPLLGGVTVSLDNQKSLTE